MFSWELVNMEISEHKVNTLTIIYQSQGLTRSCLSHYLFKYPIVSWERGYLSCRFLYRKPNINLSATRSSPLGLLSHIRRVFPSLRYVRTALLSPKGDGGHLPHHHELLTTTYREGSPG